jgi:putative ABC transport system permease protein
MTRADIYENLRVALDTLRARKVRAALTILGIVIGVTSVISVAAIIDGLNGYIQSRIKSFGSRSFFVMRIPPGYTGLGPLPAKIRVRKYLEVADAQYLKDNVPGLDISAAFAQRIDFNERPPDSMRYGDEHVERMIVRGTQPEYAAALPLFTVATGRYISEFDEEHARSVVRPLPIRSFRTPIPSGKRSNSTAAYTR